MKIRVSPKWSSKLKVKPNNIGVQKIKGDLKVPMNAVDTYIGKVKSKKKVGANKSRADEVNSSKEARKLPFYRAILWKDYEPNFTNSIPATSSNLNVKPKGETVTEKSADIKVNSNKPSKKMGTRFKTRMVKKELKESVETDISRLGLNINIEDESSTVNHTAAINHRKKCAPNKESKSSIDKKQNKLPPTSLDPNEKSNTKALKLDDVNVKTVNEKKSTKIQASVYPSPLPVYHSDDFVFDDYDQATTNSPPYSLDIVSSFENWSNSEEEKRSRLYENLNVGLNYRQILEDSLVVLNLANCEKNLIFDHHGMLNNYLTIEKDQEKFIQLITEITIKNNVELEEEMVELKKRHDDLMDLYKSLNMKLQAQENPSNQEALSAKNYEEKYSTIKLEANKRIDVLKVKLGKLQKTYNWYQKQLKIKNGMSPQKLACGVNKVQKRKVKKELKNKAKKNNGHSSDESSDIGFEDKAKIFNGSKKGSIASDVMKLINFPDKLDYPSQMLTESSVDSSDDESMMSIDEKKSTETTSAPDYVRQQIHDMLDNEIRSSAGNQIVKLSLVKDVNKSESSSRPTTIPTTDSSSSSDSSDESTENDVDKDQENESEDNIGAAIEDILEYKDEMKKRISSSASDGPTKRKSSALAVLIEDLSDTESEILAVLDRKRKFDAEKCEMN